MPPTTAAKKTSTGPTLRALEIKLKGTRGLFKDICSFAETLGESTTLRQVTVRLEKLDECWEKLNEASMDVEMHEDYVAEDDAYCKERKDWGSRYFEAKAVLLDKAKELDDEPTMNVSSRGNDTTMHSTTEHVRLPQIKLPTFDGNVDQWLSFRDLYTSLIHFKADLPKVEKFHYLKGCLEGEAKALVDPLAVTGANYQLAWETLTKRYNDSKVLKRRQVQALFKLPGMAKESVTELQVLVESFDRIVHTLDQLIQPVDYKDLLLLDILCSRLDPTTRRAWEEHSESQEQDTVVELTAFLQKRIRVLGSLPLKTTEPKSYPYQPSKGKQPLPRTSHSVVQASGGRCVACSEGHLLFQCPKFQRMTVSARDKLVRNHTLCRNCFRRGHQASDCTSRYVCRNCQAKHHTMVCFRSEKGEGGKVSSPKGSRRPEGRKEANREVNANAGGSSPVGAVSSNIAAHRVSSVLLATAVVLVEDGEGNSYPARALLDSGSECNFMSERLCQLLNIRRKRSNIEVVGIGQANQRVKHTVHATIKSRVTGFSRALEFLVLPKVTANLPTTDIDASGWEIPRGVELADPAFFESKAVDIVLGIQQFFSFFHTGKEIPLGNGLPVLTDSVFGWVVSGTIGNHHSPARTNCNVAVAVGLEELMTRFWSCEEIGSLNNNSPEEARCEEQYAQTVKRSQDGRYTVSLPKEEDVLARIGESRDIAFRRLQALERRLRKEPELRQQYIQFMEEYQKLGHMRKVDAPSEHLGKRCYLPHHPVVKQSSTTTKVRVVFDASCKTATGTSLNDALMVGPVIQDDLRSIILRCRTKQIMLVADVEKMFRQINISDDDMPLQSILWRANSEDEVETYELTTVTYGTKPAPFLATRTLQQLAQDEHEQFPLAAKAATEDVYMDDVLTGVNEEEEAVELRIQLNSLMDSGGFRLRKWASNCPAVLQGIPEENLALGMSEEVELDPDPTVRTLGLVWRPKTDVLKFQFHVGAVEADEILTKRKVLSTIATLFDPLGLIGAVITTAKIFMQRLWCLENEKGKKLEWDSPVTPKVGDEWRRFHEQLPLLNNVTVERCVIKANAVKVELHVFSDASERAYGACVYVRSIDSTGAVHTSLLTSKSKVAPLKSQSIPRLELCGALLAAQLLEKVLESIKADVEVFFWTDSTCVLQWLKSIPTTWTVFVANRVAKIQQITEKFSWNHVPGTQNPADLISRGVNPDQIQDNRLWWEGPHWLKEEKECWPRQPQSCGAEEADNEVRRSTASCLVSKPEEFGDWYISKFTTYSDLVRRTAYWMRLSKLLRRLNEEEQPSGFLSTKELAEAENVIIRHIQQETFPAEWKALFKGETVARNSPLRWFNPRLSADNLIRVGGRLGHSPANEDTKHPIVFPARHLLTRMLLEQYHKRLLHAGPQLLLGAVRLKYWPLGGRNLARQVVHNCHRCFRVRPTSVQQFMGELPAARVTMARPFSNTGVDFFGPVYVRPGPRRAVVKAYVAVFVCLCTKAVHLELVSDLSTDRFLQALRRFIARRGRCSNIYSDNGTNFVGARNYLRQVQEWLRSKEFRDKVSKECADQGIYWHFNPPSAPHFGGLWEAAVKSAKMHLLRVLGETCASIEDMTTLLAQVEACLNSRPLTQMSDDPNDLEPLTPGHFLTGASLQELPEPDLTNIPMNRLKQWQVMQKHRQEFWKRWRMEYLAQLQGRSKRWRPSIPIAVGQLVVVRDENVPPMRWKMGRILQVHPGDDGVVRVVTLKTASGALQRPVEKICILPPPSQDPETVPQN